MRLFSYIVVHDGGFAPNPFWKMCTLACCKPMVRSAAEKGDWVVGLRPKKEGNRIVYFMEVTDKKTYAEYFTEREYSKKKPNVRSKDRRRRNGDNIYKPTGRGAYRQLPSVHSHRDGSEKESTKRVDLHSDNVLISRKFTYWGKERKLLPSSLKFLIVGRGHRSHFSQKEIDTFLKFAKKYPNQGRVGYPSKWDSVPEQQKGCR